MIEHAIGEFSADLSFSTKLDVEMMPVWETFNGNGLLNSNTVQETITYQVTPTEIGFVPHPYC